MHYGGQWPRSKPGQHLPKVKQETAVDNSVPGELHPHQLSVIVGGGVPLRLPEPFHFYGRVSRSGAADPQLPKRRVPISHRQSEVQHYLQKMPRNGQNIRRR